RQSFDCAGDTRGGRNFIDIRPEFSIALCPHWASLAQRAEGERRPDASFAQRAEGERRPSVGGWRPMDDSGPLRGAWPPAAWPRAAERATGRRRGDRIVGSSRAIQDVLEQAVAAAASDLPVRISGPVGCGKEQVARAIHGWSARANGPLGVISCLGVPEALR